MRLYFDFNLVINPAEMFEHPRGRPPSEVTRVEHHAPARSYQCTVNHRTPRATHPSSRNGSLTNLRPVNAGKFTYPAAVPAPLAHIVPGTPNGTGRMCSSRMYTRLFGVGVPMLTLSPGVWWWTVFTMVIWFAGHASFTAQWSRTRANADTPPSARSSRRNEPIVPTYLPPSADTARPPQPRIVHFRTRADRTAPVCSASQ